MASKAPVGMGHDELARDLAGSLRNEHTMTWCDMQLGPVGSPRPDVYTMQKSFVSSNPMAYECKVSQADFRGDVTAGKWQTYLKYASGVYFACEEGLLKKTDVPNHCGLIIRYRASGEWRKVKKAVLSPVAIPRDAWLKLLIDGVQREGPIYRAKHYSESDYIAKLRKRFGETVAKTIADRMAVEYEIASAKQTANRIIESANDRADSIRKEASLSPLRDELLEILGLDGKTASKYTIRNAIDKIREEQKEHPAHAALREFTVAVQRATTWHGWKEPVSEDQG